MDLNDLKFSIKEFGISGADGELNFSPSGILSGVIHNAILPENCKTILTVKAGDQSKDIEVSWKTTKLTQITVSGLKDFDDGEGFSQFNNTYNIEKQTATNIIASYKYGEDTFEGETITYYWVVTLSYNTSTDTTHISFGHRFGGVENGSGDSVVAGASKSGNLLNASEITFTLKHLGDDKYTHDFSVKLQ